MEDLREERRSLENQNQALQLQIDTLQEEIRCRRDAEDLDVRLPETPAGETGKQRDACITFKNHGLRGNARTELIE